MNAPYRATEALAPPATAPADWGLPTTAPSPPRWPGRWDILSIDDAFRSEFARAKRIDGHESGMLAELEDRGAPMTLVARGVGYGRADQRRRIEVVVRFDVPPWHELSVTPRSIPERLLGLFTARRGVAVEPGLDRAFEVTGDAAVARALLRGRVAYLLGSMAGDSPWIRVGGGGLDVGWTGRFPDTHNVPILDPTALAIALTLRANLMPPV